MKQTLILVFFWITYGLAGVDHGNPSKFVNPVFGYEINYGPSRFKVYSESLELVKIVNVESSALLSIKAQATLLSNADQISSEINVAGCSSTNLNGLSGFTCTNRLVLLSPTKAIFELTYDQDLAIQEVLQTFQVTKKDLIPVDHIIPLANITNLTPIPNSDYFLAEPKYDNGQDREWKVYNSKWQVISSFVVGASFQIEDLNATGTEVVMGDQSALLIYELISGKLKFSYNNGQYDPSKLPFQDALFSPNGHSLIVGPHYGDNSFYELDIETNKILRRIEYPNKEIKMNFAGDKKGRYVFCSFDGPNSYIWDYLTGTFIWSPPSGVSDLPPKNRRG